jgi:methylamine utilization protein MauE
VSAVLPVYLTAAALLAGSALAKLRRPEPAAEALAELRLPAPRALVRVASLVELAAAALMVARPALGAPLAATLFAGFAVLVLAQLRRGSTRSCGCLGSAALPPSRLHVAVNLAFAGCCAVARPDAFGAIRHPFAGVVVCLVAATTAWALAAALELVPAALGAYRRPAA